MSKELHVYMHTCTYNKFMQLCQTINMIRIHGKYYLISNILIRAMLKSMNKIVHSCLHVYNVTEYKIKFIKGG